jgi:aminoglycoside phosphotransferase family enzyme
MTEHEIRILAEHGVYDGRPLRARLQETHISWILLTETLVFKIKKPVTLSFLDFSELPIRKALCEKELMLNKRFSSIYLDVVAVNRLANGFEIGKESGQTVDYAVMMRRMPAHTSMHLVLSQGKVGSDQMVALAEQIAQLHRNAPVVSVPYDPKAQAATFDDIESIRPVIARHSTAESLNMMDRAIAFNKAFLDRYAGRMAERARLGFIRDVHGDLHSGNIFIDKEPVVFDCIEYNDAFRQIDVLSDIAFLCMDLEAFGRQSLAEIFLSVYCDHFPAFQNPADNLIFLYYKCVRANIRAKVNAVSAMETEGTPSFRGHLEAAGRYLHLMHNYVTQVEASNG